MRRYKVHKVVLGTSEYPMYKTDEREYNGHYACPNCGWDDQSLIEDFSVLQYGLWKTELICSAFHCVQCEYKFSVLDLIELE